jgi:hypothetical protein
MGGMAHRGCALDDPDKALAVGTVRGWRLIVASLRDDDSAVDLTIDELEGCSECLAQIVRFLAASTASAFTSIAGGSEAAAIKQAEKLLAQAIDGAR